MAYDQTKKSDGNTTAKQGEAQAGGWKVQLKQDMRGLSYEEASKATSPVQRRPEAADEGDSKEAIIKRALTRWLDVNGDGQITTEEVQQRFKEVDRNKDNKLNKDEVVAALIAAGVDNWWKGIAAGKIIAKYDLDGDGMLSMDELKAAAAG